MITYVRGNLFTSPAHVLVNTVNTTGVMGKGIAKDFKDIYPDMFDTYRRCCREGALSIGGLMLYRTAHKWVLNFPTKRHFRYPSRLEYVECGLKTFAASYAGFGLTSVAFPQLGCGTGGLNWESDVRPLMEHYLRHLPIDIYIYIHDNNPLAQRRNANHVKDWLRAVPRAMAFGEFWEDLRRLLALPDTDPNGRNQWRATISHHDEGTSGLELRRGEELVEIARDDLFDPWRQLRTFGFLSTQELSITNRSAAEALLGLLTKLPYVEQAIWAMDSDALNAVGSSGVQFLSPTKSSEETIQSSLFGGDESRKWIESLTPMKLTIS